jgi:hypothetical protein
MRSLVVRTVVFEFVVLDTTAEERQRLVEALHVPVQLSPYHENFADEALHALLLKVGRVDGYRFDVVEGGMFALTGWSWFTFFLLLKVHPKVVLAVHDESLISPTAALKAHIGMVIAHVLRPEGAPHHLLADDARPWLIRAHRLMIFFDAGNRVAVDDLLQSSTRRLINFYRVVDLGHLLDVVEMFWDAFPQSEVELHSHGRREFFRAMGTGESPFRLVDGYHMSVHLFIVLKSLRAKPTVVFVYIVDSSHVASQHHIIGVVFSTNPTHWSDSFLQDSGAGRPTAFPQLAVSVKSLLLPERPPAVAADVFAGFVVYFQVLFEC